MTPPFNLLRPLWALLIIGGLLWIFLALASEIREGESFGLDRTLLLAMRATGNASDPLGPAWFEEAMRDLSALGGFAFIIIFDVTAVAAFALFGRRREAIVLGALAIIAEITCELLKLFYSRPRPDLTSHADWVYSHSFPSGHSMNAAVSFLVLATLLTRDLDSSRRQVFVWLVALVLTIGVGVSRIYLGVHWPSDVAAGWCLGAAFALAAQELMRHK